MTPEQAKVQAQRKAIIISLIKGDPAVTYKSIGAALGVSHHRVHDLFRELQMPTLRHALGRAIPISDADGNPTPEYRAYVSAIGRCNNPRDKNYQYYGGRGIKFLFTSFAQFLAEVGRRPLGKLPSGRALYSIHRKDNDGDYEPGNVKWATWQEQHAPGARRFTPRGANKPRGRCVSTADPLATQHS